ncbi:MAG: DUF6029 family protein [Flavobacteriales bacterium]
MKRHLTLAAAVAALLGTPALAQEDGVDAGQITGNVQLLFQTYQEDSLIGAQVPPSKTGFNAFGNLIYTRGDFSAGMRYESYLDPILGYPGRFRGSGVGYRYANYAKENFEVTLGNFYEQFGSGLLLRAYEERQLGIDNALDGFRLILRPTDGLTLKGLVGKQRLDFDSGLINGPGTIRAIDAEVNLNDAIDKLATSSTRITLGGSFVSRFQPGSTLSKDTLVLQLPNNVGSWGYRAQLQRGGFQLMGEYVRKINDPNADNGYIYKGGEGILVNAGWSTKGLGINVGFKGVDNMQFRSDRNLQLFDVPVNYIPAITKQHTYNLAATLYPYATVVQGEVGWSAEVFYTIPRKSKLGGKYGTKISFQYATASSLDTTNLAGVEGQVDGYVRNSWRAGSELYIRDINFDISRKFSKGFKAKYAFFHFDFNTLATPVTTDFKGIVNANVHVLETQVRIKKGHSLRTELQALFTGIDEKTGDKQDKGDWATVLAEYSVSPHWFFSVLDQYNFGNPDPDQRVHYVYGTVGRIEGAHRLSIGYGKRREGIFCIGGVCRAVPASNGFEITFTSSF